MSIFCSNCGIAHKEVAGFCWKCGTPLQNGTETQMKSVNQNSSVANKTKMNTQSEPQYHISVNCHICKAHFNDADEYEKHISAEYKKDPGKTWLECDFCDKFDHKPANNSTTFISHITTHLDGGGLYKCEFQYPGKKYKCGNSFRTKTGMKSHWKNQHNISPKSSHSQKVEVDVKLNTNNDNSNSNSHLNRIPKHSTCVKNNSHSNQINTNTNTDNTNNNNVKEHNKGTHMNRDTGYRKKYVDDNDDRDRGRNKWRDKDTNTRSRTRSRSRSRSRSKRHRSYSHRDRYRDRNYRTRSISRDRDRNRNRNRNRNRRSHSRSNGIISDKRSINQNNNNRNSNTNNNTVTNVQRQKQINSNNYRHKGTVKWFDADKKYGIIEYDNNNEEIFVYYTDIHSKSYQQQILTKGEQVEFEVRWDERKKNKKKAVNVTGPDGAFVGCDTRSRSTSKSRSRNNINRDRDRDRNRDRNRDRDRGKYRNYASRSHSSDRHKDTKDKRDKNNDKNIWNGEIVKNYECDKPFNFSLFRIDKTDIALDIQLNEKIPKNLTIKGWMNVEKISNGIVNDENDKYKKNYKEFIKNARERKKKPAAVIDMKNDHKLRIILIPTFNDRDKNMFDVDTKLEKLWKCELPKTDDLWALLTLYK